MSVTAIGLAALQSREGVRLKAYLDSVGVPTIGWGHTKGVKMGQVITREKAEAFLAEDIKTHAAPILAAIKVPVADHERDALVSIAFNIGVGGFKGSTFLRKLNAGDRAGCAKAIMSWTKPKEITSRRQAERDQFLTPYDVSLPKARSSDARPVALSRVRPEIGGEPTLSFEKWKQGVVYPELRQLQQRLWDLGYRGIGERDGKWGSMTRNTLLAFKADNGMTLDDVLDDKVWAALAKAAPRELSEKRETATAQDLAKSPTITAANSANWFNKISGGVGAGALAAAGVEKVTAALDVLKPVRDLIDGVPGWAWLAIAAGVAAAAWFASREVHRVKELRVDSYRNGGVA